MVAIRRLLPRGYLFTVLGIAVGVAGLVALGAMAERITRFIDGGDRFVLGQISVAGEGMGMGTGFTAGGLLRASKIEQIGRVSGVAAVQGQVMLPLNPTTSQFLTLTQELILGLDPAVRMSNREFRELPVRDGRALREGDRGVVVVGAEQVGKPLLMRGQVQMHTGLIFLSLLGGLAMFGLLGILLGPLIVAFFLAMVRIYERDFRASGTAVADQGQAAATARLTS